MAKSHLAPWTARLVKTSVRRLRQKNRSIGYIGWLGQGNLGDEAMFHAAEMLFDDRNIEVFAGARREALLCKLGLSGTANFDRVILGGGTLINSGYLNVVNRALGFGLPVSTLGTGVGDSGFSSSDFQLGNDWKNALRAMDRIGVRGPISANRLLDLGVENVEIVGDLAMALTPDKPANPANASAFLLNVAQPSNSDVAWQFGELSRDALSQAVRKLVASGLDPIAVAFCVEDVIPIKEVLERAGVDQAPIHLPTTADAFFSIAHNARICLCVRLHAAILSCCVGVPVIGIAYREKGHDFAESIGHPEIMEAPEALDIEELTFRAMALAESPAIIGRELWEEAIKKKQKLEAYTRNG